MMRIGLYDRHLPTLGGGERYSLAIAAALSREQPVDVISHTPVSRAAIGERLRMDLGDVRLRVVPDKSAAALASLSAEYDFFINGSNLDFIPPQARYSALVVYFPTPAPAGVAPRLRQALGRRLAQWFLLPRWREGVYGEDRSGARLLARQAVIDAPGSVRGAAIEFRLRSALPAVQPVVITVDGTPVMSLAVGKQWMQCRVHVPNRRANAHTIAITAEGVACDVPFALELDGWRVLRPGHALYRRWFAPRLPGWDSRLRNPQPSDLVGVAGSYDLVWAISRFTQQWITRYWGLPSELLYPPVDIEPFAATRSAGRLLAVGVPVCRTEGADGDVCAPGPYILSVGRFFAGQHNKQHLTLIRAFRRLVDDGLQGWELRLVGGVTPGAAHAAYLEQVRAAAQGYPIRIETDLPFPQLVERYRGAALYWHAAGFGEDEQRAPIKAEHFGITTVEAMAAGCVPLVIARGGQPELVTHGVDGFLWQTLDELHTCTLRLLGDADLRDRMAAAARASSRRFDQTHFDAALAGTLAKAEIPVILPTVQ
jgi:glycosyltransferase involved in cell wall biosynthesis